MQRENRTVKGFTLAELLIVVAIIAVLVAVSIPTFATQLEKAKESRDLAEVRTAAGKVSDAYLTGEKTTAANDAARYTTAYYNADQKCYEIWVKIEQGKEKWQSHNDDEKYTIAKVEADNTGNDNYYLRADTKYDHWVVKFFEDDQHYEFVCEGTRT